MTLPPPPLPDKDAIELLPPFPGLDLDRIHRVATPQEAAAALRALEGAAVLGFDTESKPTFNRGEVSDGPHVVQFATPDGAWIFQLHEPACRTAVTALLESPAIVKAGFGLASDRSQLLRKLGVEIRSLVDLDDVLRRRGYRKAVGVKTAVALLFGQRFGKSKKTSTSNWAAPQLTEGQLRYAANDAYGALRIHQALAPDIAAPGAADAPGPGRGGDAPPRKRSARGVAADGAPGTGGPEGSGGGGRAPAVRLRSAVPLLRIFDIDRAYGFYLDYLGFHLDWEHRFDATAPRYLQVGRGACVLHLTEHHGDCCPGATVRVPMDGLAAYHREIAGRDYPFLRPGVARMPWGEDVLEVVDPFGNRLRFCEPAEDDGPASPGASRG